MLDGCSVHTARRREKTDPTWPRPRTISAHRVGYSLDDIERWVRDRPIGGGQAPIEANNVWRARGAARRAAAAAKGRQP
jgi:hypothetical protein